MQTQSPSKQQSSKKKSNKQKPNEDVFLHLYQLYKPSTNKINQAQVLHQIQDLYQLLSQPPKNRSQRMLKKLKAQLNQLKCFKIPPYNQQNPQFIEIFKRDTNNILNMGASFMEMTWYRKGTIVEITGMKRESIKVLLVGDVAMFQPVNYRAFRNCVGRVKNGEINFGMVNSSAQKLEELLFGKVQDLQEAIIQQQQNPQNLGNSSAPQENQLPQKIRSSENSSFPLTKQPTSPIKNQNNSNQNNSNPTSPISSQSTPLTLHQCRTLLTKCSIIVPSSTPHTKSKKPMHGDLLADKDQPLFIDQKIQYATSTVCQTDCIFLQIGYQIAKQIIMLINNDRERPFIQSLLFKFQSLKYLQAKQYVTQQFMIIHQVQQQQTQQNNHNRDQQQTKKIIKNNKKSAIPIIKQLKVISSLNFQLSYTGQLYLIISGAVTIIIDEIYQKKPSTIQYIKSHKTSTPKQILHLYKNDIFGFQQIGKQKQCNLRYQISMGSKLLKINNHIFKNHLYTVFGFKKQINTMIETRNNIISNILHKIQDSLQNQQIVRHNSITFSKQNQNINRIKQSKSMQLSQNINQIRQLKYMGYQKYDQVSNKIKEYFSIQSVNKPKQSLSPEIVKQSGLGLQFSINLKKNLKQSIEIKDGWIETRSKNGTLIRKKRLKQYSERNSIQVQQNLVSRHQGQQQFKQKIQSNQNPQTNKPSQAITKNEGDTLLRRLGILNSKQIAEYNLKMVKKRPSKYQFDDLNKQAKQFKKIRQKSLSLPKLTHFYAKKQNRLFNILYKKTHL